MQDERASVAMEDEGPTVSRSRINAIRRAMLGSLYKPCVQDKGQDVTTEQLEQQLRRLQLTGQCAANCTFADIDKACRVQGSKYSTRQLKEQLSCFNDTNNQDFQCAQRLYRDSIDETEQSLDNAIKGDINLLAIEDKYGIDDDEDEDEIAYRDFAAGRSPSTSSNTKCCVCQSGSLNDPQKPTIVLHSRPNTQPNESGYWAHYIHLDCFERSLEEIGAICPECRLPVAASFMDFEAHMKVKYNKFINILAAASPDADQPTFDEWLNFRTTEGREDLMSEAEYKLYMEEYLPLQSAVQQLIKSVGSFSRGQAEERREVINKLESIFNRTTADGYNFYTPSKRDLNDALLTFDLPLIKYIKSKTRQKFSLDLLSYLIRNFDGILPLEVALFITQNVSNDYIYKDKFYSSSNIDVQYPLISHVAFLPLFLNLQPAEQIQLFDSIRPVLSIEGLDNSLYDGFTLICPANGAMLHHFTSLYPTVRFDLRSDNFHNKMEAYKMLLRHIQFISVDQASLILENTRLIVLKDLAANSRYYESIVRDVCIFIIVYRFTHANNLTQEFLTAVQKIFSKIVAYLTQQIDQLDINMVDIDMVDLESLAVVFVAGVPVSDLLNINRDKMSLIFNESDAQENIFGMLTNLVKDISMNYSRRIRTTCVQYVFIRLQELFATPDIQIKVHSLYLLERLTVQNTKESIAFFRYVINLVSKSNKPDINIFVNEWLTNMIQVAYLLQGQRLPGQLALAIAKQVMLCFNEWRLLLHQLSQNSNGKIAYFTVLFLTLLPDNAADIKQIYNTFAYLLPKKHFDITSDITIEDTEQLYKEILRHLSPQNMQESLLRLLLLAFQMQGSYLITVTLKLLEPFRPCVSDKVLLLATRNVNDEEEGIQIFLPNLLYMCITGNPSLRNNPARAREFLQRKLQLILSQVSSTDAKSCVSAIVHDVRLNQALGDHMQPFFWYDNFLILHQQQFFGIVLYDMINKFNDSVANITSDPRLDPVIDTLARNIQNAGLIPYNFQSWTMASQQLSLQQMLLLFFVVWEAVKRIRPLQASIVDWLKNIAKIFVNTQLDYQPLLLNTFFTVVKESRTQAHLIDYMLIMIENSRSPQGTIVNIFLFVRSIFGIRLINEYNARRLATAILNATEYDIDNNISNVIRSLSTYSQLFTTANVYNSFIRNLQQSSSRSARASRRENERLAYDSDSDIDDDEEEDEDHEEEYDANEDEDDEDLFDYIRRQGRNQSRSRSRSP